MNSKIMNALSWIGLRFVISW